jgi:dCMP deaminase
MDNRISWDEYFINMLDGIAIRSTCLRRKVGAIIVKDNRILTTGYNGQPPNLIHCSELGFCLRQKLKIPSGQRAEICRAVHAEENAILQASKFGSNLEGSILYVHYSPCSFCTKSILSVGIVRVVYLEEYPDDLSRELREEATWIKFEQYKG